ncbi:MAG: class IV adenylate cyclase [Thermoprotei archaeon]|jgi:adenylate cyclase class 2
MIEAEIKIPIKNPEIIRTILKNRGELVSITKQRDIYFQHPFRDFMITDEALRLRDENGVYELTYKGPKIGNIGKTRLEISINVNNFDKTKQLLENLGFKAFIRISKIRELYKIDETFIAIDNVENLGYYVEFEKQIPDSKDVEQTERELINLAKELGLEINKSTRKSYLELLLEKT